MKPVGDNKEAIIYVELYLTVHIFCFSITRYDKLNGNISICQLLEQKFNIYCGCARSRPQNDNKNIEQRHFLGFTTIALYKL